MGRRPIGKKAMTAAERQRRRRGTDRPRLPTFRPWDDKKSTNAIETNTIEAIEDWLAYGDMEAVTKWVSLMLDGRNDYEKLLQRLAEDPWADDC